MTETQQVNIHSTKGSVNSSSVISQGLSSQAGNLKRGMLTQSVGRKHITGFIPSRPLPFSVDLGRVPTFSYERSKVRPLGCSHHIITEVWPSLRKDRLCCTKLSSIGIPGNSDSTERPQNQVSPSCHSIVLTEKLNVPDIK